MQIKQVNTQYNDYQLKNAMYFMKYKKIIEKLEETNLVSSPATIGSLITLSPSDLLNNLFTYSEVEKLMTCLKFYGLSLKDFCSPFNVEELDRM